MTQSINSAGFILIVQINVVMKLQKIQPSHSVVISKVKSKVRVYYSAL